MYNANYDFLIVTHALFELTPGGAVNARKTVKVVRLCDNWRAEDITRIQLEYVCLFLLIMGYVSVLLSACSKCMQAPNSEEAQLLDYYNTQAIKNKQSRVRRGKHTKSNGQSCTDVCRHGPVRVSRCCGVLVSFWNALDFLLLTSLSKSNTIVAKSYLQQLLFVVVVQFCPFVLFVPNVLPPSKQPSLTFHWILLTVVDLILRWNYVTWIGKHSKEELFGLKYVDLTVPVAQYQTSINLSSLVMFLSVTKCFKYFQLNPSVSLAWRVLSRSAQTFVSFIFIFLIFMMALTLTGYVIFGPHSDDFYSMQRTGVQLFRMVIGGFEYEKLARSNPWIAPIYFISVALIGYFILRNLFIAIM